MAEGRAISMLIEAAQRGGGYMEEESKVVRVVVGMRRGRQIGSRPPRCERRCSACGHCEAVQVPVAPLVLHHQNDNRSRTRHDQNDISRSRRRNRSSSISSKNINNFNVAYSRGDDLSNYKPMSWKCKCGDFLFNP
ncbi:EPIDERMAL PATTERNING FACTOR-like protein [Trema orientale]|uniref:Epidermal patterning factor-like protein n=1 Tax=Trema orientale TaxID=63057 RepID=A0A2P5DDK5_TREOI|nr:EPIDERMAL PATTERNING FACTOR-like protein [Trema orientale]